MDKNHNLSNWSARNPIFDELIKLNSSAESVDILVTHKYIATAMLSLTAVSQDVIDTKQISSNLDQMHTSYVNFVQEIIAFKVVSILDC